MAGLFDLAGRVVVVTGGSQRIGDAIGLLGVVFMAVATAAPITAMTGNVPFMVSAGNGIGAPASYHGLLPSW